MPQLPKNSVRASDILMDFMVAEPFKSFRITLNSGEHYDVTRDYQMSIGYNYIEIHHLDPVDLEKSPEQIKIPLDTIASVDHLDTLATAGKK